MKGLSIIIVFCAALWVFWMLARHSRSASKKDQDVAPFTQRAKEAEPYLSRSDEQEIVVVMISGAVRSTGSLKLAKPTLVEALAQSVPKPHANLKKISVTRIAEDGSAKTTVVDITTAGKEGMPDIKLETGDRIFVPENLF